jgi:hypothetical protein
MEKEWPHFNWSTVDKVYPAKTGLYEPTIYALKKRGIVAREWLRIRKERVIAVVSHANFLRDFVGSRNYGNANCRIFEFPDETGWELEEWNLTKSED